MPMKFKSGLLLIVAAIVISMCFASCSSRDGKSGSGVTNSISQDQSGYSEVEIIPGAGRTNLSKELPDLTIAVKDLWESNSDTVGWLRLPGTTVDDVVVWKEGDNDYYLRRNFQQKYYYNGIYFADMSCTFSPDGDPSALGRNTVIYGHSMSDNKDDIKFGPMRYYLEEDFAKEHPYIFFSTAKEDLAFEVVAVFYTHFDVEYNRNDFTYEKFKGIFEEVQAKSIYNYDFTISESDKFLTLSTCVYSLPEKGEIEYPNPYRFGIMARLIPSGEKLKDEATFVKNPNIKAA